MSQVYVLQVRTGREEAAKSEMERAGVHALVPLEFVTERRGRHLWKRCRVLMPGYVFVACTLTDTLYHQLRQIPHVIQWLGTPPQPLTGDETRRILWLADPCEELTLHHPPGGRAVICAGPLVGREGDIVSVNRRRGRVRLRLELGGRPFEVNLSYTQVDHKPLSAPERRFAPQGGGTVS